MTLGQHKKQQAEKECELSGAAAVTSGGLFSKSRGDFVKDASGEPA